MTRLVNALNAVELPMLISARRQLTTTVKAIDPRGSEVRGSTCDFWLAENPGDPVGHSSDRPYLCEPGRPRKTLFTGKGPCHPRRSCEKAGRCEDYSGND